MNTRPKRPKLAGRYLMRARKHGDDIAITVEVVGIHKGKTKNETWLRCEDPDFHEKSVLPDGVVALYPEAFQNAVLQEVT